jgi:hypothetical protein
MHSMTHIFIAVLSWRGTTGIQEKKGDEIEVKKTTNENNK